MTTAHIRRLGTSFMLAQDRNDLLFAKPLLAHRPSPFEVTDSTQIWRESKGSGQ